jgi:hypothetical protein
LRREIVPLSALSNGKSRVACPGGWLKPPVDRANTPERGALHVSGAPLASLHLPHRPHAGAGGDRNWAISDRISANICRDTATSASWKIT